MIPGPGGGFLLLAALILATPCLADPIEVQTRPAPLSETRGGTIILGDLRYCGGLTLSSPDERFGGFSALAMRGENNVLALSDHGYGFSARLVHNSQGDLIDLSAPHLAVLRETDGKPLRKKKDRDSESLARAPDGGVVVAFERRHRLRHYDLNKKGLPKNPRAVEAPKGLDKARRNGGIEALTRLGDGRLLALAESLESGNDLAGWVQEAKGWAPLSWAAEDGFVATGMATLPGGDVVVLERRFTILAGFSSRLKRLAAAAIKPGARLTGKIMARLASPLPVDNFEGIAVRQMKDGSTRLYLISDDNYQSIQRTMLFCFQVRK
jgi:hypothetical protein